MNFENQTKQQSAYLFGKNKATKNEKIYLYVPYKYKEQVKKYGAKFDPKTKYWWINSDHPKKDYLSEIFDGDNYDERGNLNLNKVNQIKMKYELQEKKQANTNEDEELIK
jgi:hypothetical protein